MTQRSVLMSPYLESSLPQAKNLHYLMVFRPSSLTLPPASWLPLLNILRFAEFLSSSLQLWPMQTIEWSYLPCSGHQPLLMQPWGALSFSWHDTLLLWEKLPSTYCFSGSNLHTWEIDYLTWSEGHCTHPWLVSLEGLCGTHAGALWPYFFKFPNGNSFFIFLRF